MMRKKEVVRGEKDGMTLALAMCILVSRVPDPVNLTLKSKQASIQRRKSNISSPKPTQTIPSLRLGLRLSDDGSRNTLTLRHHHPHQGRNRHITQQIKDRNIRMHLGEQPGSNLNRQQTVNAISANGSGGLDILHGDHERLGQFPHEGNANDFGRGIHRRDGREQSLQLDRIFVTTVCGHGVRIDRFDMREFSVAEPPWDFDPGEGRHAAGPEAGDDLRGHRLLVDADARDGGLDHGVEFFFADADEVPAFGVVGHAVLGVFGDEADFEDDTEVDGCCREVLRAAVVGEGVLVCVAWDVLVWGTHRSDELVCTSGIIALTS